MTDSEIIELIEKQKSLMIDVATGRNAHSGGDAIQRAAIVALKGIGAAGTGGPRPS